MRTTVSALISVALSLFLLGCALALYWFVGWNVSAESTPYGTAHSKLEGFTLVVFQIWFYALLALFLAFLVAASLRIARFLKAEPRANTILVLFLLGVAAYPLLGLASVGNDCALGTSFPLSVPGCD